MNAPPSQKTRSRERPRARLIVKVPRPPEEEEEEEAAVAAAALHIQQKKEE